MAFFAGMLNKLGKPEKILESADVVVLSEVV